MNLAANVGHAVPIGRELRNADRIGWVLNGIQREPEEGRRLSGANPLEQVIRFVSWAQQLRHFPTPLQIQDAFEVSRATAWRWRAALGDAFGIVPPRVEGDDGGRP